MRKIIPILLLMLLLPVLCYGQGAVVFGRSDPCQNFIQNSRFGLFTRSGLAQGTTGVQSDYEYGSAEFYDDCEDDGTGDYVLTNCSLDPNHDVGNGAGGSDGLAVMARI